DMITTESRLKMTEPAKLLAGSGRGIIDDIGGAAGLIEAAKDDPAIDRPLNISGEQSVWLKRVDQLKKRYR
ncbi:MAG: hypothetical protein ACI4T4_00905, partial [Limosilactobacillus sp.]